MQGVGSALPLINDSLSNLVIVASALIYDRTFPSWIQDHNKPDYSFNKYVFKPSISDIDVPYIMIKKKNKCYFDIVKNKDTLKFTIAEYP